MQIGVSSSPNTPSANSYAEYTIYVYDHFYEDGVGQNRWKRVSSSYDPAESVNKAQKLFSSQQYQKIEIKKKFFDDRKGQNVAKTFRVFERTQKQNSYLTLVAVFLLAFSSAGLFYLNQSM